MNWKKLIRNMVLTGVLVMPLMSGYLSAAEKSDSPGTLNGGGILYGAHDGFTLKAPKGWMFDNSSGQEDGFYCVMYPEGTTWKGSAVNIYAELYPTGGKDLKTYVDDDIAGLKKKFKVTVNKEKPFMAGKSYPAIVVDFSMPEKHHFERILYIAGGESICMIVMTSKDVELIKKYSNAPYEIAKSVFLLAVDDQVNKK